MYVIPSGVVSMLTPNLLLSVFGLPEAREIRIRVLGRIVTVS